VEHLPRTARYHTVQELAEAVVESGREHRP
jgi:hypothetical protein